MTQLLNKILNRKDASKEDAKQRLKVLLIHDQVDLTHMMRCRKRSPRSSKSMSKSTATIPSSASSVAMTGLR